MWGMQESQPSVSLQTVWALCLDCASFLIQRSLRQVHIWLDESWDVWSGRQCLTQRVSRYSKKKKEKKKAAGIIYNINYGSVVMGLNNYIVVQSNNLAEP